MPSAKTFSMHRCAVSGLMACLEVDHASREDLAILNQVVVSEQVTHHLDTLAGSFHARYCLRRINS